MAITGQINEKFLEKPQTAGYMPIVTSTPLDYKGIPDTLLLQNFLNLVMY